MRTDGPAPAEYGSGRQGEPGALSPAAEAGSTLSDGPGGQADRPDGRLDGHPGERADERPDGDRPTSDDETRERTGLPQGSAPDAGDGPEQPALEDADPEEAALSGDGREENEQRAFDARVRGLKTLFGSAQHGANSRQYQAENMYFYGGVGPPRFRTGPLRDEQVRPLLRTYVRSPVHAALLDGLRRYPVQILVGPPETGRFTTALHAIAEHLAGPDHGGRDLTGRIHLIESLAALHDLDGSPSAERRGYIHMPAPDSPAPSAAQLNLIAEALFERRSVLIMIAENAIDDPTGLVAHNMLRHEPPPLDLVFGRHLSVALGMEDTWRPAEDDPLHEEIRRCRSPRQAASLAADIAAGLERGLTTEQVLRERDPTEFFATADRELASEKPRIYLLTCAVLDGSVVNTVVREYERLFRRIFPDEEIDRSKSIGEWSACVDVYPSDRPGAGSTVRLAHPRLAAKILEDVWQGHVTLRDHLLAWLKELAGHPDPQVRIKAGHATAKLATFDFDVVRREVLRDWASDGRYRTRQAVASALEALAIADEGRFAPRVRRLVNDWARSSELGLLAAAVAAYGTFLGAEYPQDALKAMRQIAGGRVLRPDGRRGDVDRAERNLANIVQRALVDVFLAGAHEQVLAELTEWARLPLWRWRRCAAACLVRLSGLTDQGTRRPLLLEMIDGRPDLRAYVAGLWRNALNREHQMAEAWAALRDLIRLAESARPRRPEAGNGAAAASRPGPADQSPETAGDPQAAEVNENGQAAGHSRNVHAQVRRLLTDIAAGDGPEDAARLDRLRFHVRYWEFQNDGRRFTCVPGFIRGE